MAKISAEQLTARLKSGSHPVIWVSGDEPLLVQEAAQQVRHYAQARGFSEREVYHTQASFQWDALLQSANSLSLFASKKLIEVRLHSVKIGDAGNKALQEYCRNSSEDVLLLLISDKADKAAQNTGWAKAVDATGLWVTVWPIKEQQLPRWIDQRLKAGGIKADSQAVGVLASKVEGNLLAALQEIEKLKLLAPEGVLDAPTMANLVMDSARFDVFALVDKILSGRTQAAVVSLNGLRNEGTEALVVLWALAREIRTLLGLKYTEAQGQPLEASARSFGVFPQRLALVKGALARLSARQLETLLQDCALVDRASKGMAKNNPWDELLSIAIRLSGETLSTFAPAPSTRRY